MVPEAIKCVKQNYKPDVMIPRLLETFRHMVNDCIHIGLENNVSTLKKLSLLSYPQLSKYNIYANYKISAIARAAGILRNREHSIKRKHRTKDPYLKRPFLSCYIGFKIDREKCTLKVPLGNREYFDIPLNDRTMSVISDDSLVIRSILLTPMVVSITISKQVPEFEPIETVGIDRNLTNVTYGNDKQIIQYDLSNAVEIAKNTRSVMKSFKRNDVRIRKQLYSKYGRRRKNRIIQLLHKISKDIVNRASENKQAIVFEDIRHIRKLYQRGNGRARNYRFLMNNSWPYHELERQIKYKASWHGIPVIRLSVKDTRGTSVLCPRCGERTQLDMNHKRQLWCQKCKKWMDRDVVAAMNLSIRGRTRLERPPKEGDAGEAMKGNADNMSLILRVDASKLSFRYSITKPKY